MIQTQIRTRTNKAAPTPSIKPADLSRIIACLENIYSNLRAAHPDARPAVITVQISTNARGHIWFDAWTKKSTTREIDEIMINSLILEEGGVSVMRTLLHELAHSINRGLNLRDTSRGNVYHNSIFQAQAEKLFLETTKDKIIGWTTPGITPQGMKIYSNHIAAIDAAITVFQSISKLTKPKQPANTGNEPEDNENTEQPETPKSRMIKLSCQCKKPRVIRAARSIFTAGPIICSICNSEFEE